MAGNLLFIVINLYICIMIYLGLKDSSNVRTNLFLSTWDINSDLITICFDDISKGTTQMKQVTKSEFMDKFIIL